MVRFAAQGFAGDRRHATAPRNRWRSIRGAIDFRNKMRNGLGGPGGELISLPPDEQAAMMKTLGSVGEDVSKAKPALHEAYEMVAEAAKRTRQAPTQ